MQIAVTLKPDDRTNPHSVPGHSHVVRDALEPKDATGFGQHGGLGKKRAEPVPLHLGRRLRPRPPPHPLLPDRHRPNRAAPSRPAHNRNGWPSVAVETCRIYPRLRRRNTPNPSRALPRRAMLAGSGTVGPAGPVVATLKAAVLQIGMISAGTW